MYLRKYWSKCEIGGCRGKSLFCQVRSHNKEEEKGLRWPKFNEKYRSATKVIREYSWYNEGKHGNAGQKAERSGCDPIKGIQNIVGIKEILADKQESGVASLDKEELNLVGGCIADNFDLLLPMISPYINYMYGGSFQI